jgi:hypothetical protein
VGHGGHPGPGAQGLANPPGARPRASSRGETLMRVQVSSATSCQLPGDDVHMALEPGQEYLVAPGTSQGLAKTCAARSGPSVVPMARMALP